VKKFQRLETEIRHKKISYEYLPTLTRRGGGLFVENKIEKAERTLGTGREAQMEKEEQKIQKEHSEECTDRKRGAKGRRTDVRTANLFCPFIKKIFLAVIHSKE
jgi:hypothetical protein